MTIRQENKEDGLHSIHDLSNPKIEPNISVPPWRLGDGQASVVIGKDILVPETYRPDRGRLPVGINIPEEDRPITTVEAVEAQDLVLVRERGVIESWPLSVDYEPNDSPAGSRYSDNWESEGVPDESNPLHFYPDLSSFRWSRLRLRSFGTSAFLSTTGGGLYVDSADDSLVISRARPGDILAVSLPLKVRGYYKLLWRDGTSWIVSPTPPGSSGVGTEGHGTSVEAFVFFGKGYAYIPGYAYNGGNDPLPNRHFLVKSPELYLAEGGFDRMLLGEFFTLNEDRRVDEQFQRTLILRSDETLEEITAQIDTWAMPGDAISFDRQMEFRKFSKFHILALIPGKLSGILISNGRKFWLASGGKLSQVMDLGDDAYKGSRWRAFRIARNRIMLVTEKFAPRILHLNTKLDNNVIAGDESLAGLIQPSKPPDVEGEFVPDLLANPSWVCRPYASQGSLSAGLVKVLVRAVNLEDNLASNFVPAVAFGLASDGSAQTHSSRSLLGTTTLADDAITVFCAADDNDPNGGPGGVWGPFAHKRMTHIEIWRTPTDQHSFFLESRIAICSFEGNEWEADGNVVGGAASAGDRGFGYTMGRLVARFPSPEADDKLRFPITLSNTDLRGLTLLTNADLNGGGLPPICRDVCSLLGVTLCFGRASEEKTNPEVEVGLVFGSMGFFDFVNNRLYADNFNWISSLIKPKFDDASAASPYNIREGDILRVFNRGNLNQVKNWLFARDSDGGEASTAWNSGGGAWTWTDYTSILSARMTHVAGNTTDLFQTAVIPPNFKVIIYVESGGESAGSYSILSGADVLGSGLTGSEAVATIHNDGSPRDLIIRPTSDFNGYIEHIIVTLEECQEGMGSPFDDPGTPKDSIKTLKEGDYIVDTIDTSGAYVTLKTADGENDANFDVNCHSGAIKYGLFRRHTWHWPAIESDEDVWFSRTDKFYPEGFPPRVLQLSRIGDTFRRAVVVNNQVAVIMDQGVHLLRLEGTSLLKSTVEDLGHGTPWPDSVTVAGNRVFWAARQGIRILEVFETPDSTGRRGETKLVGDVSMRAWFEEAYNNGDSIDAGFDEENTALRFRRKSLSQNFQTLHYSLRYDQWTLLDDDNGLRYASSRNVEKTPTLTPRMYSVDEKTGAVFACRNIQGDPYAGFVVQGFVEKYDNTTIWGDFSSLMIGEMIRIKRGDTWLSRIILTASDLRITFGKVEDLSIGDEFIVGGTHFQIRFAPFQGADPEECKTLYGVTVRARVGERGVEGKLIARVYENFKNESASSVEVPVFDTGDSGKTGRDRVLSLTGQGEALELELETRDARTDFQLELIKAEVREDAEAEPSDR